MLRVIELQNIRSYTNALFEFSDGVNIVVGPNASGKTNLLESVHAAAQGRSFKSDDVDMVRRGSEWGRIDASFADDSRTVKIKLNPFEKSFVLNDVDRKRLTHNDMIPLVLFEPEHMLLLVGEPERRRSYVDTIISQAEASYRTTLRAYKRALAQRNRLLKQESVSAEHVFVWDLRLSELAGVIAQFRGEYITTINAAITDSYRSVSGNQETIDVSYESKLPMEGYAQAHLQKLKEDYEIDRLRGFTGSGPHRDDLQVQIDGAEARLSASRGETRSIVLALKMSELKIVSEHTAQRPLLLLDDVFSELDGKRRRLLAQTLSGTQTLITTTDADAIIKSFMSDYNVISVG